MWVDFQDMKRRNLGRKGVEYIKERLAEGKTMSDIVLRWRDLDKGESYTYLPERLSDEEVIQFRTGGKIADSYQKMNSGGPVETNRVSNPNLKLAIEISSFLAETTNSICILEDHYIEPEDPGLRSLRSKKFFFDKEVYHFLIPGDYTERIVTRLMSDSYSFPIYIGFLTSFTTQGNKALKDNQPVNRNFLRTLSKGISKIFASAYDREGYVFWERKEQG